MYELSAGGPYYWNFFVDHGDSVRLGHLHDLQRGRAACSVGIHSRPTSVLVGTGGIEYDN